MKYDKLSNAVLLLLISIFLISCQKEVSTTPQEPEKSENHLFPVDKPVEETLANIFFSSYFQSNPDLRTRAINKECEMLPLSYNGVPVLWVANHPEGGYLILSANQTEFPIVAFSDEGYFLYEELCEETKNYYDELVVCKYDQMQEVGCKPQHPLWQDIHEHRNLYPSDTIYRVELEFFSDPEQETTRGGTGPGTIPDREYAKNYRTVQPLLLPARKWVVGSPYNFDMPKDRYNLKNIEVPFLSVALSLIMDYYYVPDMYFWVRMKNSLTVAESTEFSRFLSDLSTDLTFSFYSNQGRLARANLTTTIPNILQQKYGLKFPFPSEQYYADQVGFDKIRNLLYANGFCIIVHNTTDNNLYNWSTSLVDGVQEIYTKWTIKKYVGAIHVGTSTKYYYNDYYHIINLRDRSKDQWELYDYNYDVLDKPWAIYIQRK